MELTEQSLTDAILSLMPKTEEQKTWEVLGEKIKQKRIDNMDKSHEAKMAEEYERKISEQEA